jgi:hypothetical protein
MKWPKETLSVRAANDVGVRKVEIVFDIDLSQASADTGYGREHNVRPIEDVSEPLRRSHEARAVDRFFIDWVVPPGDDGLSPGELHFLSMLYHLAPDDSALRSAVHALAFGTLGHCIRVGAPFHIQARREYEIALARLQHVAADDNQMGQDSTLAALLLVDNFEVTIK